MHYIKIDPKMITSLGVTTVTWMDLAFNCPFSFLKESYCPESCMWRVSNVGRNMCEVEGGITTAILLTQSDICSVSP